MRVADQAITEEINYSNYDHEAVCRIGAMWDVAHAVIVAAREALTQIESEGEK